MAENPLTKLIRLTGGLTMLGGPLGYKVLAQQLLARSTSAEMGAANIALATVTRSSSAAAQVAVRSVAPALVVEAYRRRQQRLLDNERREFEQVSSTLENHIASNGNDVIAVDLSEQDMAVFDRLLSRALTNESEAEALINALTESEDVEANIKRIVDVYRTSHVGTCASPVEESASNADTPEATVANTAVDNVTPPNAEGIEKASSTAPRKTTKTTKPPAKRKRGRIKKTPVKKTAVAPKVESLEDASLLNERPDETQKPAKKTSRVRGKARKSTREKNDKRGSETDDDA